VLLGGAYTAWAYWRLRDNVVYDLSAPLLAVALTWLGASYYGYVSEGKDKRRIRKMFSQYVSPAILTVLMDQTGNSLKPGSGRRQCVTVLFSDIRDFTSISERLGAEMVVDLLNIHFHAMTDVIFECRGTLDKFIGDALMAYWGAPVRQDDHAVLAVTAALRMERAARDVNKALLSRDYPAIRVGVGINSGDAIVVNIGSEKKLDYTVIGDNVNVASRLEGLSAKYRHTIIISDTTHAALAGRIPCVALDKVRVKGKGTPITIYAPLAAPDDPPQVVTEAAARAEQLNAAFAHYLAREWPQALAIYDRFPDSDAARLFIPWCRAFMQEDPAADWDGVTTFTSK
jgi:adenylate cyclase